MPVASLFVISFLFCEQYQERLEKKGKGNGCHPFDFFVHSLHFLLDSAVLFLGTQILRMIWFDFVRLI